MWQGPDDGANGSYHHYIAGADGDSDHGGEVSKDSNAGCDIDNTDDDSRMNDEDNNNDYNDIECDNGDDDGNDDFCKQW